MKKKKRTAGLVLVLVCASSGIVAAAPDEQLDEYTLDTVVVEANRTKNKFGDIVTEQSYYRTGGDVDVITDDLYHCTPPVLAGSPLLSIQTYYESMWINRGLNIRYIRFHLPQEGRLQEPEEEIPLDEYRSYHRDKRSSKAAAR